MWFNFNVMSPAFKTVALIGRYNTAEIAESLLGLAELLVQRGCSVLVEKETAANIGRNGFPVADYARIGEQADLAVVLGGDGSMLSAARQLAAHGVPLVGINQGRLGFMTDIPVTEMRETLAPMIAGDYEEEHRTMLEGRVKRQAGHGIETLYETFAINDVVVSRGAGAGMVELRVTVQEQFVANFRADGLIIASPTGSTAYALSAGGPILHPGIAGWVMVPIAPHSLSNRPIVLPDTGEVSIEIVAGRDASVNFDMHALASLLHGDRICVRRSEHRVRILHPRGWSYYATLRRKLHWNEGVLPDAGGH